MPTTTAGQTSSGANSPGSMRRRPLRRAALALVALAGMVLGTSLVPPDAVAQSEPEFGVLRRVEQAGPSPAAPLAALDAGRLVPVSPLAGGVPAGIGVEEARIVALVNAERATHGLPPVRWEARLATAAVAYAGDMAERNYFSHTGLDGSKIDQRSAASGYLEWTFLGENLAAGQRSPERVVQQWMASPTHRANVLAPAACHVGVGLARATTARYSTYWVLELGC